MTMTKDELKPGDLVVLKSGGPVMTIGSISTMISGMTKCYWFDENQKNQSGEFNLECLKKAEDKKEN